MNITKRNDNKKKKTAKKGHRKTLQRDRVGKSKSESRRKRTEIYK